MRRNPPVASLAMLVTGLLMAACSLLSPAPTPTQQQRPDTGPRAALRISQVGFGHQARFARCVDHECPQVTTKVLASPPLNVAETAIKAAPSSPVGAATIEPANVARPQASAATKRPIESRKLVLHFEANSARLTSGHKALLASALDGLRRADRIVILGRTDSLGSESLNQALALARGLAVRDYLLDLSPDLPGRMSIDAKGRCCYAAPNDTGPERALNRRVEMIYAPRDGVAL